MAIIWVAIVRVAIFLGWQFSRVAIFLGWQLSCSLIEIVWSGSVLNTVMLISYYRCDIETLQDDRYPSMLVHCTPYGCSRYNKYCNFACISSFIVFIDPNICMSESNGGLKWNEIWTHCSRSILKNNLTTLFNYLIGKKINDGPFWTLLFFKKIVKILLLIC